MRDRDPVEESLGDSEDLYGVADWEIRSTLDRAAVRLYRRVQASRHDALIALALVLFVVQLAFAVLLIYRNLELGVLAALSAAPALGLVAYVWYGDPTRREPFWTLATTFVLAVLFASFAALGNEVLGVFVRPIPLFGTVLFYFLVVGPVEETVKWLAVRVHAYNHDAFGAVIDGAVYGAVAGLGFATIENAIYIVQGYSQGASIADLTQLESATLTATGRAFVGPGHVLFSAFAGYYLGLAKFNPEHRGPIVVKGLVIAAAIHGTYNTLVTWVTATYSGFVPFLAFVIAFDGLVAYALFRKLRRYRRYYHRAQEEKDEASPPEPPAGGLREIDEAEP